MRSTPTSKTPVPAAEVCSSLKEWLGNGPQNGMVHSVFHSSVNLLFGSQLVTLLAASRPLYPFSIRLCDESIPQLAQGMPVNCSTEEIYIEDIGWRLSLNGAISTDLCLGSVPKDTLCSPGEDTLSMLRRIILKYGKTDGFAPLLTILEPGDEPPLQSNLYVDFAAKRIPALLASIASMNIDSAQTAAYSIAGCGIGLTPSADDFLCGIMASLYTESVFRGERGRICPLLAVLSKAVAGRTNLVSATFLWEASLGLVSRDVLKLMKVLYSRVLSQQVFPSAMNVIAFGETSGTDILTGIYFGQKIYPN